MSDKYLVWSNEHAAWWNPNSAGYTRHVERAGRYTREEAISIARDAHDGWRKGEVPPEIAVAERDVLATIHEHPALNDGPITIQEAMRTSLKARRR